MRSDKFFLFLICILLIGSISAQLKTGFEDESGLTVSLVRPTKAINVTTGSQVFNMSDILITEQGNVDNLNGSQFEVNGGILNIIQSFLTNLITNFGSTQFLALDGSNANQNIDVSPFNFKAQNITANTGFFDKVGIGITNPTTKLEVSNAGQSEIRITDSTDLEYTQLTQIASDGNFEISRFGTGGTDFSIQPDGDIILAGTTIGNIGIGTVSPTAKLDVQDSAEEIVANFERTDDGALKMLLEANPLGVNQIWGFRNTGTFQVTDVTGGNLFPLQIEKATPTNTLYLKADGKVGIGTASPGEELEVAGDINSTGGDICITGGNCLSTVSGGGGGGNLTGGGTTNYIPKWSNATNLGNSLIYDNGANVGVGTNNPGKKLEIYKSSSPVAMRLKSVATGATNFVDLIQTSRNALGADAYFDILLDGTPFFELVHDGILDYFETTITGNLIVTGNITSENVFIPQYLYAHTNATIPILGASEWTNITFAQEDTDVKFGISHTYNDNTNHTFTIMQDGIYEIDFDIDVEDTSIGASDVDIAGRVIYVNGTEIIGSEFETDITKQGVETELSHDFLAILKAGDEIVVQFVATDEDVQISTHGTFGSYPESASVVINKVANL